MWFFFLKSVLWCKLSTTENAKLDYAIFQSPLDILPSAGRKSNCNKTPDAFDDVDKKTY